MSEIFLNGGTGKIQGAYISCGDERSPCALILHSHPQYGQTGPNAGNMKNVIVNTLYNTFAENGISVLKINFRGIGKSEGEFDNGPGEILDASLALDWLLNNKPRTKIVWVAGFSFGSWVAMQITMRRPEVTNFMIVSPPYNKYDFSFLSPCPTSGFVIHGSADSTVSEEYAREFVDKISKQKLATINYEVINGADHLYRGKLDQLEGVVDRCIKNGMEENEKNYKIVDENLIIK